MSEQSLSVAVRAWPDMTQKSRSKSKPEPIDHIIVFDTETTVDPTQRLNFGCFRYYRRNPLGIMACLSEGFIFADDLPHRDPDGFAVLKAYVDDNRADTVPGNEHADWKLGLISRTEFVNKWLYDVGYRNKRKQTGLGPATVVGFNLPFDLSRLALDVGAARGQGPNTMYVGGFSFTLWNTSKGKPNTMRPRLRVRSIDSKRSFIGYANDPSGDQWGGNNGMSRGEFLDLRTLAFALTGKSHTLASAGKAFGVENQKYAAEKHGSITTGYVDYCRNDVKATFDLFDAMTREFAAHPISVSPSKTYSTATIAKAYLSTMGVEPINERLTDFPKDILGYSMSAFYGGRAECRIRKTPLPVSLNDFTSMYPTVNALMGLWDLLTHERIDVIDVTEELNTLLATVRPDDVLNPETWRGFVGIAQLSPDGDVLPVRAMYAPEQWNIGVNHLTGPEPLWYTIPDVIAAVLLGNKRPTVLKAVRFVPAGEKLPTLSKTMLRGEVEIDPVARDFFVSVVEAKQRIKPLLKECDQCGKCSNCSNYMFTKIIANAGSYGIFSELVSQQTGDEHTLTVHGGAGSWEHTTSAPEQPGRYCFPPIAACITGAARLMLATLERLVSDAGGTYVFMDTDSIAVVADDDGKLYPCEGGDHALPDGTPAVRALAYDTVETIRHRFTALIPYDRELVPELIDEQFQGWCYSISAKRYALYRLSDAGQPEYVFAKDGDDSKENDDSEPRQSVSYISKTSEHGLGHLMSPIDPGSDDVNWRRRFWEPIIYRAHGLPVAQLPWLDNPAMIRFSVSNWDYYRAFATLNEGKGYDEQVKPFNFMVSPTPAQSALGFTAGHPALANRCRLIGPYETHPDRWLTMDYVNYHAPDAGTFRVTKDTSNLHAGLLATDPIPVKTFREVFREYVNHPELKYDGPDGNPCNMRTVGLLRRRHVHIARLHHIGKESNKLDELLAGFVKETDVLADYTETSEAEWRDTVLPVLARFTANELAERTGVSARQIRRIRAGQRCPGRDVRATLSTLATSEAARELRDQGRPTGTNAEATLAEWRRTMAGGRACLVCGDPVTGRARYCGAACRKRASRNGPSHTGNVVPFMT